MIFSDDAMLLSFFSRNEGDQAELEDEIIKYIRQNKMESNRPTVISTTKDEADADDYDMVYLF
mgnify:CR=1 FL=1